VREQLLVGLLLLSSMPLVSGNGVADSVDAFPSNPSMDSWISVILSLIIISGLVALGLFFFYRSKKPSSSQELWESDMPIQAPSFDEWD